MKTCSILMAMAFVCQIADFVRVDAAEKVKPVRMGCGLMTFETVPGWGLGPDGKSVIGPTHGSVVIDKAGNIYTSADMGVFVFSPEGNVIRRFVGDAYGRIHDMEIRAEADGEFIYGARNANAEGIKLFLSRDDVDFYRSQAPLSQRVWPRAETIQSDGDHGGSQRGYFSFRWLCQQSHFQVRQNRQIPETFWKQRERS